MQITSRTGQKYIIVEAIVVMKNMANVLPLYGNSGGVIN